MSVLEDIILSMHVKGAKKFVKDVKDAQNAVAGMGNQIRRGLSPAKKAMEENRQRLEMMSQSGMGFGRVMAMSLDDMKGMKKYGFDQNIKGSGKLAWNIRKLTHGMRGFRMEMLGVMFFGMMLQQTFLGLLRPVMEVFGVFDLFRVMLIVLFLPVMQLLFPVLLDIMTWFMDLPEGVKMAIGILLLIGIVIGTLLFLLGSFALGIGSVILALGPLGLGLIGAGSAGTFFTGILGGIQAAFAPLSAAVGGFGAAVAIVFAIIIAIVIGLWFAIKENFANIRDWIDVMWSGIVDIFNGALDVIMGIVDLFVSIIKGDFDGVKAAITRIFKGLLKIIWGAIKFVLGLLVTLGIAVFRVVWGVIKTVWGFWKWLWEKMKWLWDLIKKKVIEWGGDMLKGLVDKIKSWATKVKDAILGLFPQWARDAIWKFGQFTIKIFKFFTGGDDEDNGGGGGGSANDFVWRPGTKPMRFSSADTLVGFKGGRNPFGGSVNVTNYNDIKVVDARELQRILDERDRRMVDQIRRLIAQ